MAKSYPTKDAERKNISDVATRIMERMVHMPPKPHKDMKLGKRKVEREPSKASPRRASKEKVYKPSDDDQ